MNVSKAQAERFFAGTSPETLDCLQGLMGLLLDQWVSRQQPKSLPEEIEAVLKAMESDLEFVEIALKEEAWRLRNARDARKQLAGHVTQLRQLLVLLETDRIGETGPAKGEDDALHV